MSKRSVLVSGATGNVGGSVAKALLQAGHHVRALVRVEDDPRVSDLVAQGAEIAVGDLSQVSQLVEAATGVESLFAVTTPMRGVDLEVQHGRNLVDASVQSGIQHLVLSSVASADRKTGIPHFDSKAEIEAYLKRSSVPWTTTAPVFFYENLLFPWNAADIAAGRFRQALPSLRALQMISLEDVGSFNALTLEAREPFLSRRIDIASVELTGTAVASILSEVLGRTIEYEEQSLEEVRSQMEDMARMYEWFDKVGFQVEIPELHHLYPSMEWTGFSDWAKANRLSLGHQES